MKKGPFTIIEYKKDLSVTPSTAMLAFYCNEMNAKKRQLICDLKNTDITLQSGAMQWSVGNVNATTGIKGFGDLFGKALRGKVTGESAIKPEYTGNGTLVLEPTYKHIILMNTADWNGAVVLDDGLFLACDSALEQKVVMRTNISSAALGGEGLFNLGLTGNGIFAIESRCPKEELIEIELNNDVLKVDGNLAIAWSKSLDDTKIDLLRGIMKDMNTMTGVVTPKVVAETVVTTDENGNSIKTTTYVTKKVLTVSIIQLSVDEISALYNFNDEQKALLEELMSEEYNDLWAELLGASGQIIQGNSSFVGTGMFAWPFENDQYISSRFGTRVDPISGEVKTHGGTDIAAPLGTPILAAADGVVVIATWHNSYGYYVKIKHDDTYSTLYAHCSALHVSVGQKVKQGQVIADCGSTGDSTGNHLHFEVLQNGIRVDSFMFFSKI